MPVSVRDHDLFRAIRQGTPTDVEALLDAGADPDVKSADGRRTPLTFVAGLSMSETYRHEMIALLLRAGASVQATNDRGETPLHVAVRRGDTSVSALLLARGADIHAADADGNTALHVATAVSSATGKTETIDFLLHAGANSLLRNAEGLTPRMLAEKIAPTSIFGGTAARHLEHWDEEKDSLRGRFEKVHAQNGLSAAQAAHDRDRLLSLAPAAPRIKERRRPPAQLPRPKRSF